jgi:hypothetical protein
MASAAKKRETRQENGVITYVSMPLNDPRFVELDRRYAEEFDRLWEEHHQKELEAERKLLREGFVID